MPFRKDLIIGSTLVGVLTFLIFARVLTCGFTNYDDLDYVTENTIVRKGISWDGLVWAFGKLHGRATYWHPLTWISHMIDCQLFGLNPRGHHFGNLLVHSLNAVLLFIVLAQLTGRTYLSVTASLVFALHPLQVDTVAWVAERKNVLTVFFALLALLAYTRFAKSRKVLPYVLSLLAFAACLMSKPALVVLPCVFLLLDFWPLRRLPDLSLQHARLGLGLIGEKLPFFALSLGSALITILGHEGLGIVTTGGAFSFFNRAQNALVSYGRYLKKAVYPNDLAIFYPHPGHWDIGVIVGVGLLLVCVTAICLKRLKESPWLFVGWFWFLGSLVPALGLIQVGSQSMADRFAYFPLIGLAVAGVWGVNELLQKYRSAFWLNVSIACVVLGYFAGFSLRQTGYWQSNRALWEHALAVTPRNHVACNNLADAWLQDGQPALALPWVDEALRLNPNAVEAWCHRGNIYRALENPSAALTNYAVAARMAPKWVDIPLLMGQVEESQSKWQSAIEHYAHAVELDPQSALALNNLSWLLATAPDPAVRDGRRAVQAAVRAADLTSRRLPVYLGTLAAAYAENEQFDEAVAAANAAIARAAALGNRALAEKNIELRALYLEHKPFHQRP